MAGQLGFLAIGQISVPYPIFAAPVHSRNAGKVCTTPPSFVALNGAV